jgi:Cu/Zn superoxide dismutase
MKRATVTFPSDESYSNIDLQGYILFTQFSKLSPVSVEVKLSGLSRGNHGFHVHEKGIPKRD